MEQLARALVGVEPVRRVPLVDVRRRGAIDQQAEQLGPAVVAAGVHELLALVDQGEIERRDDDAFARADRFAEERPVGGDDGGEAATGDGTDRQAFLWDEGVDRPWRRLTEGLGDLERERASASGVADVRSDGDGQTQIRKGQERDGTAGGASAVADHAY